YNPNKLIKYGFKFYGLAGSDGMIYDILPSCGSTTFDRCNLTAVESSMGVGAKAVIALCKHIHNPEAAMVYFDNWFASVPLMSYLRFSTNILSTGTIRKDRTQNCPFTDDKKFSKLPRGTSESFVSSDAVVAVRWLDSKPVCLASTAAGIEPKTTVKRFEKAAKARVDFECPRIIQLYNSHMGGVDLSDQYVAAHRVPTRSKRWYFPIIGYLVDLAVVNSYRQYCRDNKLLGIQQKDIDFADAKAFRFSVSKSLCCLERQKDSPLCEEKAVEEFHIPPM
ncbi:PiggyBac transposable element-derived protein 2, partial [Frankliniella fusca]